MESPRPFIVDSHQDIAWHVHKYRRDFSLTEAPGKAMVTLPFLLAGGVALSFVTLFAEHNAPRPVRRKRLLRELEFYLELPEKFPRNVMQVASVEELHDLRGKAAAGGEVWGFMLAMEGADLLESPDEIQMFHEKGLRMLSLTWNERNRWAAGANHQGGLTQEGALLLHKMRELGIILDVSHLNEQSFFDAAKQWSGPLCATHSNPAALCENTRNLTDEQLHLLHERGAVVGTLLYNGFLDSSWRSGGPQTPLPRVAEHIEYLIGSLGSGGVGIGSDFDGGLTANNTPEGLNTIADLPELGAELQRRGHSAGLVAGVLGENWFQFLGRHLPQRASPRP
ncbi:membrane dipeptidase [bacterium]|nr:membrane dipeptidase [bacterium]